MSFIMSVKLPAMFVHDDKLYTHRSGVKTNEVHYCSISLKLYHHNTINVNFPIRYNNFTKISSDRVAGFLQPMGRSKAKKRGKKLFLLSPLKLKNYFPLGISAAALGFNDLM